MANIFTECRINGISTFCRSAQRPVDPTERLTWDAVHVMKRDRKRVFLEPIRYPVVHLKPATPEGAIQLIAKNK